MKFATKTIHAGQPSEPETEIPAPEKVAATKRTPEVIANKRAWFKSHRREASVVRRVPKTPHRREASVVRRVPKTPRRYRRTRIPRNAASFPNPLSSVFIRAQRS